MTRWEFTYVDLGLERDPGETIDTAKDVGDRARDAIDRAKDAIAQLGEDGWEPVGEVMFVFNRDGSWHRSISELMFKRPHPD